MPQLRALRVWQVQALVQRGFLGRVGGRNEPAQLGMREGREQEWELWGWGRGRGGKKGKIKNELIGSSVIGGLNMSGC